MSDRALAALSEGPDIHLRAGAAPQSESVAALPHPLGATDFTLLELLCEGRSVEEIAARLDLDRDTAAGRIGELIRLLAR